MRYVAFFGRVAARGGTGAEFGFAAGHRNGIDFRRTRKPARGEDDERSRNPFTGGYSHKRHFPERQNSYRRTFVCRRPNRRGGFVWVERTVAGARYSCAEFKDWHAGACGRPHDRFFGTPRAGGRRTSLQILVHRHPESEKSDALLYRLHRYRGARYSPHGFRQVAHVRGAHQGTGSPLLPLHRRQDRPLCRQGPSSTFCGALRTRQPRILSQRIFIFPPRRGPNGGLAQNTGF